MIESIFTIAGACWDILLDSAPYVLLGFFIAGLLKAFIPGRFIHNHLGGGRMAGVFKASLLGIPIPLCSCGVIPAAAGLKAQGADRGAVASFMISTPETGVDSIAVTWALLDPVMTVIRPVTAFMTAMLTGVGITLFDREGQPAKSIEIPDTSHQSKTPGISQHDFGDMLPMAPSGCDKSCCAPSGNSTSRGRRLRSGLAFAFGDLLTDIGPWLLFGIGLAGVITVWVSPDFIETWLGDGIGAMLIMILVATPLYVCATASTPIAAALALKGLSPGAALVFLMAGPATNAATITVVYKLLGRRAVGIYLGIIVVSSLIMGMAVNGLYRMLGLDIMNWVHGDTHASGGPLAVASAVLLLFLILKPMAARLFKRAPIHHDCPHC